MEPSVNLERKASNHATPRHRTWLRQVQDPGAIHRTSHQRTGVTAEITKVTDLKQIMALGVMMTPALAINGTVKVAGRVPSVEEIKKLLV